MGTEIIFPSQPQITALFWAFHWFSRPELGEELRTNAKMNSDSQVPCALINDSGHVMFREKFFLNVICLETKGRGPKQWAAVVLPSTEDMAV